MMNVKNLQKFSGVVPLEIIRPLSNQVNTCQIKNVFQALPSAPCKFFPMVRSKSLPPSIKGIPVNILANTPPVLNRSKFLEYEDLFASEVFHHQLKLLIHNPKPIKSRSDCSQKRNFSTFKTSLKIRKRFHQKNYGTKGFFGRLKRLIYGKRDVDGASRAKCKLVDDCSSSGKQKFTSLKVEYENEESFKRLTSPEKGKAYDQNKIAKMETNARKAKRPDCLPSQDFIKKQEMKKPCLRRKTQLDDLSLGETAEDICIREGYYLGTSKPTLDAQTQEAVKELCKEVENYQTPEEASLESVKKQASVDKEEAASAALELCRAEGICLSGGISCRKKEEHDPCNRGTKKDPCQKIKSPCPENKKEHPCDKFKKKKKKKEDPCAKYRTKEKKKEDCESPIQKWDPCKDEEGKKEDPCKKKEDPCKKKEDPCKKKNVESPIQKWDPCKDQEDPRKKKEDPCKKIKNPCGQKDDPCKKKEDPCKKKEDPCKKKEDPCKKKDVESPIQKWDPCKDQEDPCKKKEDPCKKVKNPCGQKDDPCKKKEDPCKKKEDPCKKKEDPCKKSESPIQKWDPCKDSESPIQKWDPCKDQEDPCKKKEDACKKKKDPCKKAKGDPCKMAQQDPCKKPEDSCKEMFEDPCKRNETKDSPIQKWDPCKDEDRCDKPPKKKCGGTSGLNTQIYRLNYHTGSQFRDKPMNPGYFSPYLQIPIRIIIDDPNKCCEQKDPAIQKEILDPWKRAALDDPLGFWEIKEPSQKEILYARRKNRHGICEICPKDLKCPKKEPCKREPPKYQPDHPCYEPEQETECKKAKEVCEIQSESVCQKPIVCEKIPKEDYCKESETEEENKCATKPNPCLCKTFVTKQEDVCDRGCERCKKFEVVEDPVPCPKPSVCSQGLCRSKKLTDEAMEPPNCCKPWPKSEQCVPKCTPPATCDCDQNPMIPTKKIEGAAGACTKTPCVQKACKEKPKECKSPPPPPPPADPPKVIDPCQADREKENEVRRKNPIKVAKPELKDPNPITICSQILSPDHITKTTERNAARIHKCLEIGHCKEMPKKTASGPLIQKSSSPRLDKKLKKPGESPGLGGSVRNLMESIRKALFPGGGDKKAGSLHEEVSQFRCSSEIGAGSSLEIGGSQNGNGFKGGSNCSLLRLRRRSSDFKGVRGFSDGCGKELSETEIVCNDLRKCQEENRVIIERLKCEKDKLCRDLEKYKKRCGKESSAEENDDVKDVLCAELQKCEESKKKLEEKRKRDVKVMCQALKRCEEEMNEIIDKSKKDQKKLCDALQNCEKEKKDALEKMEREKMRMEEQLKKYESELNAKGDEEELEKVCKALEDCEKSKQDCVDKLEDEKKKICDALRKCLEENEAVVKKLEDQQKKIGDELNKCQNENKCMLEKSEREKQKICDELKKCEDENKRLLEKLETGTKQLRIDLKQCQEENKCYEEQMKIQEKICDELKRCEEKVKNHQTKLEEEMKKISERCEKEKDKIRAEVEQQLEEVCNQLVECETLRKNETQTLCDEIKKLKEDRSKEGKKKKGPGVVCGKPKNKC